MIYTSHKPLQHISEHDIKRVEKCFFTRYILLFIDIGTPVLLLLKHSLVDAAKCTKRRSGRGTPAAWRIWGK